VPVTSSGENCYFATKPVGFDKILTDSHVAAETGCGSVDILLKPINFMSKIAKASF
jgi:hypothetical protein